MVNKERIVKYFIDMAMIPSPSYKERDMANYLIKELKKLGLEVYEDSTGEKILGNAGNIVAVLKGNKPKRLLISAHMDTVEPCEKITPIVEDDIIKTNGDSVLGADDKAGIASILELISILKENKIEHPEIVIVFSVAEECGLHGAKNIDLSKFGKINYGYILDAGGDPGICYNKAPYAANGKYIIVGKSSHAGLEPEKGVNSFIVLAKAINKLKLGRVNENTTCNIGVVNGGFATNIVMPRIEISFEARSLYEDELERLLKKTAHTLEETCKKYKAEFINNVYRGKTKGYELSEDHEVIKVFKKSVENLGYEFKLKSSGGGSDTNIYNMKGIPSVNISIGMENIHSTDEFIKIDSLVNTSMLLVELLKNC